VIERTRDVARVNELMARDFPGCDMAELLAEPMHVCLVDGDSGAIFAFRGPGISRFMSFSACGARRQSRSSRHARRDAGRAWGAAILGVGPGREPQGAVLHPPDGLEIAWGAGDAPRAAGIVQFGDLIMPSEQSQALAPRLSPRSAARRCRRTPPSKAANKAAQAQTERRDPRTTRSPATSTTATAPISSPTWPPAARRWARSIRCWPATPTPSTTSETRRITISPSARA
jgi:hypothetical protein